MYLGPECSLRHRVPLGAVFAESLSAEKESISGSTEDPDVLREEPPLWWAPHNPLSPGCFWAMTPGLPEDFRSLPSLPNSGGNSSPLKQLRLRPGGATRAAPPAPPPAHAPLPPSVPATAAYFHFRGHRGKDGKEREKRLAEALACAAAESIEEAALEHSAPPLKVASAAAQIRV